MSFFDGYRYIKVDIPYQRMILLKKNPIEKWSNAISYEISTFLKRHSDYTV